MVIGVLRVELRLYGTQNLKQKRGVIKKLLSRCRNNFPVSAAEVDHQDLWQRTTLGFCVVNTSEQVVAPLLQRLEDELAAFADGEVIGCDCEYIHC